MKNNYLKYFINYVLYASPLIIFLIVWAGIMHFDESPPSSSTTSLLYNALGIHGAFWILCAVILSFCLVMSKELRQELLVKLARIKERDERESQIAGGTSKAVFLSSTALLIFLLLTSAIDVTISKKSEEILSEGEKSGTLSVGLGLDVIDHEAIVSHKEGYEMYFQFIDIPITKSGLILLLLIWNISSYQYFARTQYKE